MRTCLTTTAAVLITVLAITGCSKGEVDTSPSPSPASTSPTPSASGLEPSPSLSATPPPTAGPLSVEGELSFSAQDFGGVAIGESPEEFWEQLELSHQNCGDENFPSVIPQDLSPNNPASNWEVFLMVNWDQEGVDWLDWDVKAFLLVAPYGKLSQPTGPVGPRGLRLGAPEATIESMFPSEAASSTTRDTYFEGTPTDADGQLIPITERVFTIANVDGGPMIITTRDGVVVTIMWGDPDYVSADKGFLACNA